MEKFHQLNPSKGLHTCIESSSLRRNPFKLYNEAQYHFSLVWNYLTVGLFTMKEAIHLITYSSILNKLWLLRWLTSCFLLRLENTCWSRSWKNIFRWQGPFSKFDLLDLPLSIVWFVVVLRWLIFLQLNEIFNPILLHI